MKKFLTFALVCCLVFSSSVYSFAAVSDSQATSIVNDLSTIKTTLNNIYSRLGTIKDYLYQNGHSIAYWVEAIHTWMQPLYSSISSIPTNNEQIKRLLGYVSYEGSTEVIDPYLAYQSKGVAQWVSELNTDFDDLKIALTNQIPWSSSLRYKNAHSYLVDNSGNYSFTMLNSDGSWSLVDVPWNNGSPLGNIAYLVKQFNDSYARFSSFLLNNMIADSKFAQTFTLWNGDNLQTSTFTPSSSFNGVYTWLSKIQEPVARLSYVMASDQDIEAREKAADNQAAVVDKFIDSSGSGAASTSDFSSVSDLSSGFKNNISTEASVSGIWNIFNADNFGWFSQETADQLDTSGSSKKTLRNSDSYPTPLLDQQTEDIMKILGGNDND